MRLNHFQVVRYAVCVSILRLHQGSIRQRLVSLRDLHARIGRGQIQTRDANVIRDALVTHAMLQNNWPIVEIRSTALAAAEVSEVSTIATAG